MDSKRFTVEGRCIRDPFELDVSWTKLKAGEKELLLDLVDLKYSSLVVEAFAENPDAAVIVLSKGRVVKVCRSFISARDLTRLEEEEGSICIPIVNRKRFIIEESVWSDLTSERVGDWYPTVPIVVGGSAWAEERVFKDGVKLEADFDTGNWGVLGLPVETCRRVTAIGDEEVMFSTLHLGRRYHFAAKEFKVGVEDVDGCRRTLLRLVFCVSNWWASPLTAINPRREAILGRDVMLEFPFEVLLNPIMHRTFVKLL